MITIEAAVLTRAMKNAAAVTESRNTIPILSNVLLRSDGDMLEIVTTNLDVEYRERVPLVSGTGGDELATTVDARRLAAVAVVADKGGQLALALDDKRLTVKNGRSRWTMPVLPTDDFPRLVVGELAAQQTFAGADLAAVLARVMWAASTEESRYYLNGPLLHAEAGKTAFATTNGHALMWVRTQLDHPEDAPDVILMPKWARILEGLAREAETVSVKWSDRLTQATLETKGGAITLTGKAIDGTFPDFRRVVPSESDVPVTVDPSAMRAAVAKVVVLAMEKTRAVKVEREDNQLRLSCSSPDSGVSVADVPVDGAKGHETGFDSRYLDQMLAAIGGDSVVIHQNSQGASPARFERVVADGAVGVVMPMRV